MLIFRKSDIAIFSKNRFVGCKRRSLFFKMIMMIEAFPVVPINIITNMAKKNYALV